MVHAICDFCGKDCDMTATLLTLTPRSTTPYGTSSEPKSFVICGKCAAERHLPNPYESYHTLYSQDISYEKTLENYTDEDRMSDSRENLD